MPRRRRLYAPGLDAANRGGAESGAPPKAALDFDALEEARRRWDSRGWPEPDAMAAAHAVMRASQIILTTLDGALEPLGLTYARYEVLAYLSFSQQSRLSLGKLSARLMVHPASMTNTLNRLEADHLARRVADQTDRRTVYAEITDTGRAVLEDATARVTATRFALGALDLDQLQSLVDIVREVRLAHHEFELPLDAVAGAPNPPPAVER